MALGGIKLRVAKGEDGAKRKGWITRRTGKGLSGRIRGRSCVVVDSGKKPTKGPARHFKGRGSTLRFMGCYIKESDAKRALARAVKRANLK